MKKVLTILLCILLLSGCVQTQYWVKEGVNLQHTAKDLHNCRLQANQGGEKVYTALELEAPCMTAKGYNLSNTPTPQ